MRAALARSWQAVAGRAGPEAAQDISDPLRPESLTDELRWKEIGFDRFRREDDRQRVVEHS